MKNKRKIKKIRLIFFAVMLIILGTGCTNANSYQDLNTAYNRKNGTQNRSMILDTLIASTLYNNPEILGGVGFTKSKGRGKAVSNTNSMTSMISNSSTTGESFTTVDNMGAAHSVSRSSTISNTSVNTNTHTKTKGKSSTRSSGMGIKPNFDFFTK